MRSKQRTATEKKWHEDIAHFATNSNWLCSKFGGYCVAANQFQLDHILGAQAKRKVNLVTEKIGEWVVIPVPIDLHDITSNNPLSITKGRRKFEKQFGNCLEMWDEMLIKMKQFGYEIPFSNDVIKAVLNG